MDRLSVKAPAKLNLFLHVTGRRADGYHLLQTLFQLLDFHDRIELSLRADGEIRRRRGAPGVGEDDDLAVRAARLLKRRCSVGPGCDIVVDKHIPLGGGLGGGSSDAAAVLRGLNRLWQVGLDEDRLAEIGLELGADVPVFVRGRSAWAEGVGERLTPVSAEGQWYLVATPACVVSTARVFGSQALTRQSPALTIDRFTCAPSGGGEEAAPAIAWDALWAQTRNDCEPVASRLYPPVAAALEWLSRHSPARMTGTGASVFAPFSSRAGAEQALGHCPGDIRAFVARGVSGIDRQLD